MTGWCRKPVLLVMLFWAGMQTCTAAGEADPLAAYTPATVEMIPVKVSEHAWYVQGKAGVATSNGAYRSHR